MAELTPHHPSPLVCIPAEFEAQFNALFERLFRECTEGGALNVMMPALGPSIGNEISYALVPMEVHVMLREAGIPFRVAR